MADKFAGEWQVVYVDNLEQLLDALEIDEARRPQFHMYRDCTFGIRQDGDVWVFSINMPWWKKENRVKFGEVYDDIDIMGRKTKSQIEFQDGKIIERHNSEHSNPLTTTIIRELQGDEMVLTTMVKDVVVTSRLKKA